MRKPGGFYLVTDGPGKPCGFLPADVPETIKVTRGPQWHDLSLVQFSWEVIHQVSGDFIRPHKVEKTRRTCPKGAKCSCPMNTAPADTQALLMWVGMTYYKTADRFQAEAERMGISRRIPRTMVLSGRVTTSTPILLAHKESGSFVDDQGEIKTVRQIFRVFTPKRIEYILTGKETADELDRMQRMGITLIDFQDPRQTLFDGND